MIHDKKEYIIVFGDTQLVNSWRIYTIEDLLFLAPWIAYDLWNVEANKKLTLDRNQPSVRYAYRRNKQNFVICPYLSIIFWCTIKNGFPSKIGKQK